MQSLCVISYVINNRLDDATKFIKTWMTGTRIVKIRKITMQEEKQKRFIFVLSTVHIFPPSQFPARHKKVDCLWAPQDQTREH